MQRSILGVVTYGAAFVACSVDEPAVSTAGTSLFFPVIDLECSNLEPVPFFGATPAERSACATGFAFSNLSATLDGRPIHDLTSFEVESPDFKFTVPDNNVLFVPAGRGRSTANGVYLLLKPLSRGHHTLTFSGALPDFGGVSFGATYEINVKHTK